MSQPNEQVTPGLHDLTHGRGQSQSNGQSAEFRENDRVEDPSSKHRRLLETTPTIKTSNNKLHARRPASLPRHRGNLMHDGDRLVRQQRYG
jgi:hypothetical protein